MKLTARLNPVVAKVKIKITRPRKPKAVKPVKKNTWQRNLRAADLRWNHRQQQRPVIAIERDETRRTCPNCSTVYHGRVCPQCGQNGVWSRFTWRQAILNFLDIWGLGNRPMFRTLRDLFLRPGYMVRDYVHGQRQYYFPPFKLLALMGVFTLFMSLLPGVEIYSYFSRIANANIDGLHLSGFLLTLAEAGVWFAKFLSNNLLYECLFLGVIMVVCMKVTFRNVGGYNMIETYIFLVFVISQVLLCWIPVYLLDSLSLYVETHGTTSSTGAVHPIASGFLSIVTVLRFIHGWLVVFLFCLDFRQFYGLSWKSTISRLLASALIGFVIVGALTVTVILTLAEVEFDAGERKILTIVAYLSVAIVLAFVLATYYLRRNRQSVNSTVQRICKGSMLSVLWCFDVCFGMDGMNYTLASSISVATLYALAATVLSLLPVPLYKKYHRMWMVWLALLVVITLVVVVNRVF